MKAIVSISSLNNYSKSDVSLESFLKRYAIFYDEIFIDTEQRNIGQGYCNSTFPEYWFSNKTNEDFISKLINSDIYPFTPLSENKKLKLNIEERFNNFFSDGVSSVIHAYAKNVYKYLHPRNFEDDFGYLLDYEYEIERLRDDLLYDLASNLVLNNKFEDTSINLPPILSRVVKRNHLKNSDLPIATLFSTELVIPDFDSIFDWNDVIELRKDSYITSFREKLKNIKYSKSIDEHLVDELQNSTYDLIDLVKPNKGANLAKAILGNLPLPIPVNPIAIAISLEGLANDKHIEKKYGHLFFLSKVRDIANK